MNRKQVGRADTSEVPEFFRNAVAHAAAKRKGQVCVEGVQPVLLLEEWTGKEDGKKQSKMRVVVDDFQFLEKREDGGRAVAQPGNAPAKAAGTPEAGMEDVPF